ncbi:MAG: hypothetical protein K6B65_04725 [Bacilli bacterium]|nr:hypothetical protein [Bacilli bacterium]
MSSPKNALRERSERYLRSYQKLCIYILIPFCLDFFAVVIGCISNSFHLYFSLGVTRFFLDLFTGMNMVPLTLVPSFLILACYFGATVLAAKGKLFAVIGATTLYTADLGVLIAYFITHLEGADVAVYILSIVVHTLFLVLFAFMIIYYAKATKALREEKKGQ